MKSIEQLKKLENNPHYTLTEEERQVLQSPKYTGLPEELPTEPTELPSLNQSVDSTKYKSTKTKLTEKNVAAKEIGQVHKHPSDPAVE